MNPIRAAGNPGSIGRYAAPVLSTAKIATIASSRPGEEQRHIPTRRPRPARPSRCAQPVRRPHRVRGMSIERRSPEVRRHRLRCARHLRGEQRRNRHSSAASAGSTPSDYPDHIRGGRAPASSSTINRRQPPRRVDGHRHQHPPPTARSTLRCWPRRTRRCGTPPSAPIPAGSPGLSPVIGQRRTPNPSGAVWVYTGSAVTCSITQTQPSRGIVDCPARGSSASPASLGPAGDGLRLRVGLSRSTSSSKGTSWCSYASRLRLAHLVQQLGESGIGGQINPQHQCVAEDPHQLLERSGSRRPVDREIPSLLQLLALSFRQQRCQRQPE